MFSGKNILIFDDDLHLLETYKKTFEKLAPDNKIACYSRFSESIYSELSNFDAVIFDYYFDPKYATCDLVKNFRKMQPKLFVLCCSGMFFIKDGAMTCVNNELMKHCLNSGAHRVSQKDPQELIDILDLHFKVRDSEIINVHELMKEQIST